MATLTSTKIKNTYDALLKASDNDAIGSSAKQITDGLGNGTPLYISTTQIGIGVTPEATYDLHVYSNAKVGGNLTITGDLTVNGTTTTVGTDTLSVKDPLIVLANNNTSADSVDIGFYGKYAPSGTTLYAGLFRDTGDNKFKIFRDLEDEPTTTVNTSGTGYTVATLVGNVEGTLTGVIASITTATTQSANDNSTKVATTAYVDTSAGNYLPLAGGTMSGSIAMGGNNISGGGTATFTSFVGDLTGNADTATALETARTIQVSGDIAGSASFDGTADINISTTIQPNSVALGTDTTGNYVATISGTANEITVSDSGSESAAVTISLPSSISVDVTGDLTGDVYNADGSIIFNTGDDSNDGFLVDGVRATTQSQGDNSTKIATTAYVDSAIGGQDTLAEILANGNTTGGTDIIVSTSDQIFLPDGSVTNPAISFSNDTDSGIYHSGTQFIIAHAGSNKMIIANSQVTLEDRLIVNDTINADDGILIEGASNPYLSIHDETNETYTALWSGDTEAALTFSHSLFRITSSTNNFTGTDLVTITSGGNVGINDTNPSGAAGYTYLTINNASNGAAISFKESSTERAAIYYTNSSNLFNIYATETGSQLVFGTNAAERMRIDSSGGVGIGAGTIPADHRLQIHNPSFTYSRFALTNSATGSASGDGLKFQIENLNAIIKNQEDGYLTFGTNGRETDLHIDSSGQVGIGATSPASKLEVYGNVQSDTISIANSAAYIRGADVGIAIGQSASSPYGTWIQSLRNTDGVTFPMSLNPNGGNVGIGTNSPATKLHIKNAPNNSVCYVEDTTGYALFQLGNTGGGLYFGIENSAGTAFNIGSGYSRHIYSTGTNDFHISTNASSRITINGSSGFVGIAKSPSFLLDLKAGTLTEETVMKIQKGVTGDTGGHTCIIGLGTESSGWAKGGLAFERTGSYDRGKIHFLQENTGNTDTATLSDSVMTIDSIGRVGIGADPADWAFGTGGGSLRIGSNGHIQDDSNSTYYAHNLYYNGGWKFLDSNAHKANYILMADDGSMQFSNTTNTGTSGQAATVVERMRIDSSGNLGINQSSPTNKIHAVAASAITDTSILRLSGGETGFSGSNDANIEHSIIFDACAYSAASGIVQRDAAKIAIEKEGSWNQSDTGGGTDASLVFSTNNGTIASPNLSERMRITSGGALKLTNEIATASKTIDITNSAGTTGWTFGNGVTASAHQFVIYDNTAGSARMLIASDGSSNFFGEIHNEMAAPKIKLEPTTQNNASIIELGVLNAGTNAYARIDAINLSNYDTNLRFYTNAASSTTQVERMRINSLGRVDIGTRSYVGSATSTTRLYLEGNTSGHNLGQFQMADFSGGFMFYLSSSSPSTNQSHQFYNNRIDSSPSVVGSIAINSTTTSFNTTGSDERSKKNIEDWNDSVLSKFQSLQPKKFHFNFQEDTDNKDLGFIAQNEVGNFPEAYPLTDDDGDGEYRYKFNPSGMVVYLMKAIKEQQEIINDLKSRIEILENN